MKRKLTLKIDLKTQTQVTFTLIKNKISVQANMHLEQSIHSFIEKPNTSHIIELYYWWSMFYSIKGNN